MTLPNNLLRLLLTFGCCLLAGALRLTALVALPAVPAGLPAAGQATFQERHDRLAQLQQDYRGKLDAFIAEYGREIEDTDPRAPAAQARKAELETEAKAINGQVRAFARELKQELTTLIATCDERISATREQLAHLGFDQRAEDFEDIHRNATEAVARLREQMVARLQDLVSDKAKSVVSDAVLERLKTLSPKTIKNASGLLKRGGISNPELDGLLRSFTPTASREVLATNAKKLLDLIGREQALWNAGEKLQDDTVAARQEAVIELVSLVTDIPGLDELKNVAAGAENVGEAWISLAVLRKSNTELEDVTGKQLDDLKTISRRMEEWVKRRNLARTELAAIKG